jgi:chromosome segregation protein
MTRIEKIEMQGFKSFAKKTIVNFPSNFSVVCGPNGSGKSNILDSLVFVLGRTSAKTLRADRMFEMVFHGSKTKPAAEVAKVSMYIDNSDKTLPVEEEKVVVTRKINKNGVSIYKLNGKTVTRENIQEILRYGHIHPDGHNIILQGDVTDVIERSPLEGTKLRRSC